MKTKVSIRHKPQNAISLPPASSDRVSCRSSSPFFWWQVVLDYLFHLIHFFSGLEGWPFFIFFLKKIPGYKYQALILFPIFRENIEHWWFCRLDFDVSSLWYGPFRSKMSTPARPTYDTSWACCLRVHPRTYGDA